MKLTDTQHAHLRTLEDPDGGLSPYRVVEDAQRPDSPLHALFNWDVTRAAHAFWLHQAREIIGAVTYHVVHRNVELTIPRYVRDPSLPGDQAGYRSTTALQRDPDAARESLILTLTIASGHIRRALMLAPVVGMEAEIAELIERITGLQQGLRLEDADAAVSAVEAP